MPDSFDPTPFFDAAGEEIGSVWVANQTLYTAGRRLLAWSLTEPGSEPRTVSEQGPFRGPVCAVGRALATVAGNDLVLIRDKAHTVLSSGVFARELLPFSFEGEDGVLWIQRGMQLRFCAIAGGPAKDVYSFYSASEQGGLMAMDVDGDGRQDLYCGNYWLRGPAAAGSHWRLFAIKLWIGDALAAVSSLAWAGDRLAASQSHLDSGRLATYTPPGDRTQLWTEQIWAERLSRPIVTSCAEGIRAAEQSGAGRVFALSEGRLQTLGRVDGLVAMVPWAGSTLVVTRKAVTLWK